MFFLRNISYFIYKSLHLTRALYFFKLFKVINLRISYHIIFPCAGKGATRFQLLLRVMGCELASYLGYLNKCPHSASILRSALLRRTGRAESIAYRKFVE